MKKVATIMYLGIALFAALGLFYCLYYVPMAFGFYQGNVEAVDVVEGAFYWACSLPCFLVLLFALRAAGLIGRGEFFSEGVARKAKAIGMVLSIDSAAFLVANVAIAIFRMRLGVEVNSAALSLVGIGIGVCAYLSGNAIREGMRYRESGEGIL